MDVSLITSLYRSETHLETYLKRARQLIQQTGLTLEIVIVANDPTEAERALLEPFAQEHQSQIRLLQVPRESLYASWNRGLRVASGGVLGFWNVDDERTAAALEEGAARIAAGCELVEFAFRWVNLAQKKEIIYAPQYDPTMLHRKKRLSPFFLFSRDLFTRAGDFDANFRITGDFEWGARPVVRQSRVCHSETIGGTFYLHGGNLSGALNERETLEDNIVFLRQGAFVWGQIRPLKRGDALREAWETWGNPQQVTVPDDLQAKLWGDQAQRSYQDWLQDYQQQQRRNQVREWIRRSGLRPLLAKLGIVKAGG
jgi:glycosyltransferase involved in cell wall biosynthesis